MEWITLSISSLLLALASFTVWQRKRDGARRYQETCLSRLDEVVKSAEQTKRACFTSLESVHGRLELLHERANAAEQRLGSMVEPPQLERKEQYQAAALLLAGGNSIERVAAMLALPLSQVELVQELQKFAPRENGASLSPSIAAPSKSVRRRRKNKPARREVLPRVRPILLTDVVRHDGATVARAEASKRAAMSATYGAEERMGVVQ